MMSSTAALAWCALGGPAIAGPDGAVVVTTKPVHALVARVMAGTNAAPVLIVEGAASAHTFTLKPSVARAINAAALFIRVSAETEPFTQRLAAGLPASVKLVTLTDPGFGLRLLPQRRSGVFEAHVHAIEGYDGEAGHDHAEDQDAAASGRLDGHVWLDPVNAEAIVDAVAAELSRIMPANAAAYAANARQTKVDIAALQDEIAARLAPLKTTPFVVFHDAYQYFEARFGMTAAGSITLGPDQAPSARRLSEIRTKLKALGAVCVFAEPGYKSALLDAVIEGTGARVGHLDPEGQSLAPSPDLYFDLMRELAINMVSCMSR